MTRALSTVLLVCSTLTTVFAQDSTAPAPQPSPAAQPENHALTKKDGESLNTVLTEARKATAEKRYAASEALMLPITQQNPGMILPWVELGTAQLGLKKYGDAENSFKMALGTDAQSLQQADKGGFYQQSSGPGVVAGTATRASRNTMGGAVTAGNSRSPEILGVSWASLGEVYAHQGKVAEAQAAFDSAAKAMPAQAATYRHNEAVVFFAAGQTDAQLAAAEQAIALDPARSVNYYFKAQALVSKATMDPKTNRMILPPGCTEAYQKYLQLEPNGQFSADAKGVLAAAGIQPGKK